MVDAFDVDYPRAVLYALVLALAVGVVVAATTSATAFGAYNARWDGASTLRSEAEAVGAGSEIVRNTTAYADVRPSRSVALVLSPDQAYAPAEAARLRRFVRRGGTLVVAEDFGAHGDDLLAAVGATARFDGTLLRDERYNYRSPAMPIARNVTDGEPLVAGVGRLTLNHGTVVEPGDATVLVRSSGFAYLDVDGSGDVSGGESLARRPVATVERVGEGRVVAVSDPSIFINAMLDQSGNREFARNLFAANEHVLLDYSHTANLPPLVAVAFTLRETAWLQVLAAVVALGTLATWQRGWFGRVATAFERDAPGSGPRPDAEEISAYVREHHPDWDRERVERVVATVRRGGEE